jgi:hypothetical protein
MIDNDGLSGCLAFIVLGILIAFGTVAAGYLFTLGSRLVGQ